MGLQASTNMQNSSQILLTSLVSVCVCIQSIVLSFIKKTNIRMGRMERLIVIDRAEWEVKMKTHLRL